MFVDARVPVRFGRAEDAGPEDAVLVEGDGAPVPGRAVAWFRPGAGGAGAGGAGAHAPGCACCLPRGAAAEALTRLFLDRVRGRVPQFRAVLAAVSGAEGEAAVRDAVASDPLVSGRFRLR